jgi:TolA-binding protein
MPSLDRGACALQLSIAAGLLLLPAFAFAQEPPSAQTATPTQPSAALSPNVRALADAVRELQGQVQLLHTQMDQLRANDRQAQAEVRELRHELRLAIAPSPSFVGATFHTPDFIELPAEVSAVQPPTDTPTPSATTPQEKANADRIGKLEEDQQLAESKLKDQY